MSPKDVSSRLIEHSGLSEATPRTGDLAFFDRIQSVKAGGAEAGLDAAVADVIDCFQRLNESCNRGTPEARDGILNLDVAYAVSGMTCLALEAAMAQNKAGKDCGRLMRAGWKIACAWDLLLAGDIEDIHENLLLEAAARNLD